MWTECSGCGTMGLLGGFLSPRRTYATGALQPPVVPSFSRGQLLTGRLRCHSRALLRTLDRRAAVKVLATGATGKFAGLVGQALVSHGIDVRAVVHEPGRKLGAARFR